MTQNTHTETQNASTTNGSKPRRITASMFFKKALKQEESTSPKADETIQRLEEENRKLRQELNDANSRIHELESESESVARENKLHQQREIPLLSSAQALLRSTTAPLYTTNAREGAEDRDDDDRGETSSFVDDESCDGLSVEVEAATVGFDLVIDDLLELEEMDEIESTTGSACTIPTGNDKKSKLFHRKLRHRSRRRGGGNAHLNYFSRRSPPLESITEIDTTRRNSSSSSPRDSSNDYDYDYGDDMTTTSDLTASVAGDDLVQSHHDARKSSLMSGRRLPLSAMKSLLRASSAESAQSAQFHGISFVLDNEPVLYGEI